MAKNLTLNNARKSKSDEFYTRLSDIENEITYYKDYFIGKIVYCNCDNPSKSNFVKYFEENFNKLGIKKLIATEYINGNKGNILILENDKKTIDYLNGDGDFRSKECINYLKECDVVVTNPPFSLFREYVSQLIKYNKKFLIIGNSNSITYKDFFPYIKNNQIWVGCSTYNKGMYFTVPESYEYAKTYNFKKEINGDKVIRVASICWFTNIEHNKKNIPLKLTKKYDSENYLKYDEYDAIEVSKVSDIPMDYDGVMGVPITFINKYCPSQFEIIGLDKYVENNPHYGNCFSVNGKKIYVRILIKKKQMVVNKIFFCDKELTFLLLNTDYKISPIPIGGQKPNIPVYYELPYEHPDWMYCKAYHAPLLYDVQRWLATEKNIYVSVLDKNKIYISNNNIETKIDKDFKNYDDALMYGLKMEIKKLLENK